MLEVIKRDGRKQNFDLYKVQYSIRQAAYSIKMELNDIEYQQVFARCKEIIGEDGIVEVEKLQNAIEKALYLCGHRKIRDSYKSYRKQRTQVRDTKSDVMKAIIAIGVETDRDNANVGNNFSAKLLRIASESNKWAQLAQMPKDLAKEHENLDLYYHDLDSYNLTVNCLHIPTGKILQRGFNTGYGTINKPKRIETAADLSCILMQSTQNDMFGGQSHPNFDNDMAPFVESSRQEIATQMFSLLDNNIEYGEDYIKKQIIEPKVRKSVHQAMQGVVYNLNTMHCLPYYEKIWVLNVNTDKLSLMTMQEIHETFEEYKYQVITLNEDTKEIEFNFVKQSIYQGKKNNLLTIKGKHGSSLTTTDDHDYLAVNDNTISSKKANEIDHLLIPYKEINYAKAPYIFLSKFSSRKMQNYQSDTIEITEDFARLIGYYVADGSVIAGSQLAFSVCDADIILDLINIMTVAYPGVTYTELYREDGSSREIRFNVGKVWTQAFKDMCGENAHSKTVPDQILFGVKNLKIEFLKGYCLCDGCMKKGRYIEVATVSEELIDKLSLLLMTLNEIPFVTKKERVSPFSGELCEIYYLTITGLAENRLNLGFGCNAKFEVSKLNKNIVNNCETIQAVGIKESVSDLSEEIDVYDLSIENNENFLTAANIFVHNCRAGSQVPFSSINIGLPTSPDAALVCEAFLIQYDRGLGKGEQPIFPNIIFRVKAGVNRNPEDPYYYLFQLACRVAAKRMNPTFMNIDADFNKEYYDQGYVPATMGCRTYLMSNVNGEPGVEGRGNNAPTTINLPRIGIRAMLWMDEFKQAINTPVEKYDKVYMEHIVPYFLGLFDEKINKSRESLLHRYDVLKKLKVKDLPFVAGQGLMKGTEGLDPNDSIEPILKQGTWGIGFTGLAETLIALCGKHHGESELARDLGEKIIEHLRKRCDEFRDKDQLNWSCYATPAEGLSGKFVPVDRRIFGIIPGVTDKDYYTNSYHVPVNYSISIKDKLAIEAPYHKLCNGGHISYIEMDDYPQGSDIENIIRYAYENTNISYVGINFHIRYCKECGTYLHGENECPNCGSHDIQGVSRVTGYLSLDERFGPGKSAERLDRSNHNGDHTNNYHLDKEGED